MKRLAIGCLWTGLCLLSPVAASGQSSATPPASVDVSDPSLRDRRETQPVRHWDALEGRPAPSLRVLSHWHNADARSWEALRGKVVLIDFWATWCGPCRAAIPHLTELHEKYADDGLVVLGVHSRNGYDALADFIRANPLPYAIAADPTGRFGKALGIKFIPSYFVVGPDGTMRVAGANRNRLEDIVRTMLGLDDAPADGNAAQAAWPEPVEKKLYADDFRGRKAPQLEVERWLTPEPETKGKVVLIDFWATWCPPCREAIPELNEFQKKFRDDLVVIGVSAEEPDVVEKFAKTTRLDYALGIDTQGRTAKAVGVTGIPHVLVISTDGIVRWQGYPLSEEERLSEDIIKRIIDADPGVAARRAEDRKQARPGRSSG